MKTILILLLITTTTLNAQYAHNKELIFVAMHIEPIKPSYGRFRNEIVPTSGFTIPIFYNFQLGSSGRKSKRFRTFISRYNKQNMSNFSRTEAWTERF